MLFYFWLKVKGITKTTLVTTYNEMVNYLIKIHDCMNFSKH